MARHYEPPSDFLKAITAGTLPLSGSAAGDVNLRHLIVMMADADRANRDWATFLLAQEEIDTPMVRDALMRSAGDEDEVVRAEAISGLAKRDPALALPLVQQALRGETVVVPLLEAAALCAHPSLIADLRVWAEPSSEPFIDQMAAEALEACEKAASDES